MIQVAEVLIRSRVAIKRCGKVLGRSRDEGEATIAKRMLREVLLIRALDHPNVISIVDLWHNDKDVYLVLTSPNPLKGSD